MLYLTVLMKIFCLLMRVWHDFCSLINRVNKRIYPLVVDKVFFLRLFNRLNLAIKL